MNIKFAVIDGHKRCSKCKETLSVDNFYNSIKVKSGLSSTCKGCSNTHVKKYNSSTIIDGKKGCSKCKNILPIENFKPCLKVKCGLTSQCINCSYTQKPRIIKEEKSVIIKKEKRKTYPIIDGMRVCSCCNLNKSITEYGLSSRKQINTQCKKCISEVKSIWSKNNRDKVRANKKRHKQKISERNKLITAAKRLAKQEKLSEARRLRAERILFNKQDKERRSIEYKRLVEFRKTDEYKEVKIQKRRDYEKKRMSNPLFAFRKKLTNNIRKSLTEQNYTKDSRAAQILGAEWNTIFEYFNSLFRPGMSWENHGEWHIDHIIPLCSANTEEDVLRLNHYTNLQPLWGHENLEKGCS